MKLSCSLLKTVIENITQIIDTFSELNATEILEGLGFRLITELYKALLPIKVTVESLSSFKVLRDPSKSLTRTDLQFAQNLIMRLFPSPEDSEWIDVGTRADEALSDTYEEPKSGEKFSKSNLNLRSSKVQGKRNKFPRFYTKLPSQLSQHDVERVFSATTFFYNKIRSRLSDISLNALIFLEFFYKRYPLKFNI